MKAWRRPPAPGTPEEDWTGQAAPGDGLESGAQAGWVTVSTGAAANMTAVLRWAAWALLIAGPVVGIAAWLRPPTAAGAVQQAPAASVVVRDMAGPAGFAELYVSAYVQAGKGSEASLQPYFPNIRDITLEATPGVQRPEQLAAVQVKEVSAGYWSVTVAARIDAGSDEASKPQDGTTDTPQETGAVDGVLRYFQVPVKSAGSSGGYVAAALPAEVAAPDMGEAAVLDYGTPVPADTHDAATAAVSEFLAAYLTGTGELDRYLSPGTDISQVSPAPYKQVKVAELAERGGEFRASAPVIEGTQRELLVNVDATDVSGQVRPLTYALQLKARDGRWEIASLDAAPALSTTTSKGDS
ncbi:conjugal transfer protein [Streptomyces sp. NPDC051664]|uniref:conjugal transfer protein n=1 Tax=Streptomyces sp. NPDC051664 TaxID=3365668 RepID=UPI00378CF8F3